MELISDQKYQAIRSTLERRPDAVAITVIELWEHLASTLVPIIGEGGFQSLFSRSYRLTSVSYPWMVTSHPWENLASGFPDLKLSFSERDISQINDASIFLFITFIDILSTLIGDLLATSIVRSAWGDDVFKITGEEPT